MKYTYIYFMVSVISSTLKFKILLKTKIFLKLSQNYQPRNSSGDRSLHNYLATLGGGKDGRFQDPRCLYVFTTPMFPHEIILHYSSLVRLSLSPSAKYNEIFSTHVIFFCPIPFVEHHVNKFNSLI